MARSWDGGPHPNEADVRESSSATPRENLRFKDSNVTDIIFKILHEPPELHGFHRTNWRQIDLYAALKNTGTLVSIWTIRRVIRANRYQWRKAKIVLTSNDPEYRLKVDSIKRILSELSDDECFFSIDEYGPFNIRFMCGQKALCSRRVSFGPPMAKRPRNHNTDRCPRAQNESNNPFLFGE